MPELTVEEKADLLGGEAYPEGRDWRCGACGFTTDDDGPDCCPRDGAPLARTALSFPLGSAS